MLLDIALDGYLRLRVDRMEKSSMSGDDLISVVSLVLRSFLCTVPNQDFQQVRGRSTRCSCPKGNQGAVRTEGRLFFFVFPSPTLLHLPVQLGPPSGPTLDEPVPWLLALLCPGSVYGECWARMCG